MKKISFESGKAFIQENHLLSSIPALSETETKPLLLRNNSNSILISERWNDFEQYIEYNYRWDGYGMFEYMEENPVIHFIRKSNMASYFTFRGPSFSMYIKETIDEIEKNGSLHYFNPCRGQEINMYKARIKYGIDILKLKADNYYKGWEIKGEKFKSDLYYIEDNFAFAVPISSIIESLCNKIKKDSEYIFIENTTTHVDLNSKIVRFNFESDNHISGKRYTTSYYSGSFSLSTSEGKVEKTGQYSYSF